MSNPLERYIAETLKELHKKNKIDFIAEAKTIIERMCDPDHTPPPIKAKKNHTKCTSYNQFLQEYPSDVHQVIYHAIINADEPLSRQEIANQNGLRLSTVCGRVAELLESSMIQRAGRKLDTSTNRMVEVLEPNSRIVK